MVNKMAVPVGDNWNYEMVNPYLRGVLESMNLSANGER